MLTVNRYSGADVRPTCLAAQVTPQKTVVSAQAFDAIASGQQSFVIVSNGGDYSPGAVAVIRSGGRECEKVIGAVHEPKLDSGKYVVGFLKVSE